VLGGLTSSQSVSRPKYFGQPAPTSPVSVPESRGPDLSKRWAHPRLEDDEPGTGHDALVRFLLYRVIARSLGEGGAGAGDREPGICEHAAELGQGEETGALVKGVAGASLRSVAPPPGAIERDDTSDKAARGGKYPFRLAKKGSGVVGEAEGDDEDYGAEGAIGERQALSGTLDHRDAALSSKLERRPGRIEADLEPEGGGEAP
jgi:hypothetical protein